MRSYYNSVGPNPGLLVSLEKGGIWKQTHIQTQHYVKMEPEITMILPQDKKCPRLSVNHRKLQETNGTIVSYSPQKEPVLMEA